MALCAQRLAGASSSPAVTPEAYRRKHCRSVRGSTRAVEAASMQSSPRRRTCLDGQCADVRMFFIRPSTGLFFHKESNEFGRLCLAIDALSLSCWASTGSSFLPSYRNDKHTLFNVSPIYLISYCMLERLQLSSHRAKAWRTSPCRRRSKPAAQPPAPPPPALPPPPGLSAANSAPSATFMSLRSAVL
jgi:hypothetical protein